jgi:hypothetical protein
MASCLARGLHFGRDPLPFPAQQLQQRVTFFALLSRLSQRSECAGPAPDDSCPKITEQEAEPGVSRSLATVTFSSPLPALPACLGLSWPFHAGVWALNLAHVYIIQNRGESGLQISLFPRQKEKTQAN